MKVFIETHSGERLIGEIVEPNDDFFRKTNFNKMMFTNGIWIKRKKHISFVAEIEIKIKRAATLFDRE